MAEIKILPKDKGREKREQPGSFEPREKVNESVGGSSLSLQPGAVSDREGLGVTLAMTKPGLC